MLQESGDPLAILNIGLATRHRLDVLGIDEEDLEAPLQDLVDGPPVDAGTLHRDVRAPGRGQPVGEPEQFPRGCAEGPNVLTACPRRPRRPQACGHRLLVHVESTADAVQDVHGRLLATAPLRRRDVVIRVSSACSPQGRGRQSEVPCVTPGHDGMDTGSRHQSKADLSQSGAVELSLLQRSPFIRCRWGPAP